MHKKYLYLYLWRTQIQQSHLLQQFEGFQKHGCTAKCLGQNILLLSFHLHTQHYIDKVTQACNQEFDHCMCLCKILRYRQPNLKSWSSLDRIMSILSVLEKSFTDFLKTKHQNVSNGRIVLLNLTSLYEIIDVVIIVQGQKLMWKVKEYHTPISLFLGHLVQPTQFTHKMSLPVSTCTQQSLDGDPSPILAKQSLYQLNKLNNHIKL